MSPIFSTLRTLGVCCLAAVLALTATRGVPAQSITLLSGPQADAAYRAVAIQTRRPAGLAGVRAMQLSIAGSARDLTATLSGTQRSGGSATMLPGDYAYALYLAAQSFHASHVAVPLKALMAVRLFYLPDSNKSAVMVGFEQEHQPFPQQRERTSTSRRSQAAYARYW